MQSIPEITISAINYPVYSIDFDAGFSSGPSTIVVNFVSENGQYELPELDVNVPVTIKIGDLYEFEYYAVEYKITESQTTAPLLEVSFNDKSIILDKVWVGLKNKHGYYSKYPLMIVGKEVDPCSSESLDEEYDPCDPCGAIDAKINCAEERESSILEVSYTFNDLLDEIENFSPDIKINNRPNPNAYNNKFKEKYTGSLRSVLANWGADYGFTFFWENDALNFVDLRQGFEINTRNIELTQELISQERRKSLRGTVSNGFVGHFAQEKRTLPYGCGSGSYRGLLMAPIKLEHILNTSRLGYYGSSAQERISQLELLSQLSFYSTELRDTYVLKHVYGITDGASASLNIGKVLPLLGGMVIKKVYRKDGGLAGDRLVYQRYVEDYLATLTKFGTPELDLPKLSKKFLEVNGYFMLVEKNEETLDKLHNFEQSIAKSFLGRYFIRKTTSKSKFMNWSAPEGDTVRFYEELPDGANDGASYVLNLPFIQIMNSSDTSKIKNLGVREILGGTLTVDGIETFPNSTFLLLERDPAWNPLSPEDDQLFSFLQQISLYMPREIPIIDLRSVKREATENSKMLMIAPTSFSASVSVGVTNIYEQGKTKLKFTDHGGAADWGLQDTRCRQIAIDMSDVGQSVVLQGPAQGYSTGGTGVLDGGYLIIGDNQGTNYSKTIPKKEVLFSNIPDSENTLSTIVNIKEISDNIRILINDQCEVSTDTIKTIVDQYIQEMRYSINEPIETKSLTFAGIPAQHFSIQDGIEAFGIRIGSSGVETTLSFSNKSKTTISDNLLLRNFQSLLEQNSHRRNYLKSLSNTGNTFSPDPVKSTGQPPEA